METNRHDQLSKLLDGLISCDVTSQWEKAESWKKLEGRLKPRRQRNVTLFYYAASVAVVAAIVFAAYNLNKPAEEPTARQLVGNSEVQKTRGSKISVANESIQPPNQSTISYGEGSSAQKLIISNNKTDSIITQTQSQGRIDTKRRTQLPREIAVETSQQKAPPLPSINVAPGEKKSGLDMLASIKQGEVLVLEGVQFSVSTSIFLSESYPILQRLVEVLQTHPSIKINIEGHICCGPDPKSSEARDYFFDLSVIRARHVYDYLVEHHISAERLSYEGFGFSKPRVYPERSERDRFRNRRVELRIISN